MHRRLRGILMRFTDTKSETLNLRVSPTFKRVLKEVADHEPRSMVNMLEVLLCDYCDSNKITPLDCERPAQKQARKTRNKVRTGAPA